MLRLYLLNPLKIRNIIGKIIEFGGEDFTWREIIKIMSNATGKNKLMVPAPVFAVQAVASLFEGLVGFL